jgi:serine/threonine-protein kinase
MASLSPGEVVLSKYRIERVLGEGGMGIVVAAHHLGLGRRVALKVLRAECVGEPTVRERFAREARAASRIDSEHVVRVLDVDALSDGTPFMVMEHLEGSDLASVLAGGHRISVCDAALYVVEACRGIQEAHRLGIVHRDVKPANLFLETTAGGHWRIKVLDFGISKVVTHAPELHPGLTQVNSTLGSPNYMAPEQILASESVDARADVWGLGITLYELLTGAMPFSGKNYQQLVADVLAGAAVPPSRYRSDLPRGLEAVILRCLAKDPAERYQTAAALASALRPYTTPEPRRASWRRLAIITAALGLAGVSAAAWARACTEARPPQNPPSVALPAPPARDPGATASGPSTRADVASAPPPSSEPVPAPATRPPAPATVSAPVRGKASPHPPLVPAPPRETHTID